MNDMNFLNDIVNLNKIRYLNIKEISEKLDNLGYRYKIYCEDLECKTISSIYVYPKFNKELKISIVSGDAIDLLNNLGYKVSYVRFYGGKKGIFFEKVNEGDKK